jgi:anti-sigma factor RsiW
MTDHEQIYPYVVDQLSTAEAIEVEQHLAACPACAEEVQALQTVVAELSSAVAVAPPASMRSTVLAAIQGVPQASSVPVEATSPGLGVPEQTPAIRQAPVSHRESAPAAPIPIQRRSPSRWPALLAAAAVLAALTLGGWAWHERQAAGAAADQAAAQSALIQLLSAPDVQVASGRVAATGSSGTVVMSRSRHEAVLVASALPALPAGKVYEAWAALHKPRPAGTFSPEAARTMVRLPSTTLRAKQVMITVEPAGGSKAPTTAPIFSVRVPESA